MRAGQVSCDGARPSKDSVEQSVKRPSEECRFGTIVRALWPVKPALNLAQRIGCTERAAQFYLDGDRKPSGRALVAVINELIS